MTSENSDNESLTITAEDIQQAFKQMRTALQPISEWLQDLAPAVKQIMAQWKHWYLRDAKRRIQAIYWAKGHKHRLTRKELIARGITRR